MDDAELKKENARLRRELASVKSDLAENKMRIRFFDDMIKRVRSMAERESQETWKRAGDE